MPPFAFKPCTEERYDEMLNILPPRTWIALGFLVGEPVSFRACRETGDERATWSAFAKVHGEHYEAEQALTVLEFVRLTPADVLAGVPADQRPGFVSKAEQPAYLAAIGPAVAAAAAASELLGDDALEAHLHPREGNGA